MDQYSSKIALYEECSKLLCELDAKNEVTIGLVATLSNVPQYSEKAIEELIKIGAARRGDTDNLCRTENTHSLKVLGYFQEKISDLNELRDKDKLNRRIVVSAETSANAAQDSAKSSRRANYYSCVGNIIAIISLIVAIISLYRSCS